MIKKIIQIFIFLMVVAITTNAQKLAFDPLLDPNVVIIPSTQTEEWNSVYMWYPGQLAAFYQQQCAAISKERCVNVGYPGKFFAISSLTMNKSVTPRVGK